MFSSSFLKCFQFFFLFSTSVDYVSPLRVRQHLHRRRLITCRDANYSKHFTRYYKRQKMAKIIEKRHINVKNAVYTLCKRQNRTSKTANIITGFYRTMLCIARNVLSKDVCLSVRPSVTRRYSVETAKHI